MKANPTVKRNFDLARKIQRILTVQNKSQSELANTAGIKLNQINSVIWGIHSTPWIRKHIAAQLGFKSWKELVKYKEALA